MNIFVCIKQVPDTETKIQIQSDGQGIETSSVNWILNPYDEFAIEEALQKKEALGADKVIALSVGPERVTKALRSALAMGCDEALHVETPENLDSRQLTQALARCISKKGDAGLVLLGKLAIDTNEAFLGAQLAQEMSLPYVAAVSKLEVQSPTSLELTRQIEGGVTETYEMTLPGVVTANKGLNQPRFVSLPGIMKAKKKPLEKIDLASLELSDVPTKSVYYDFTMPPAKATVQMLDGDHSVEELVEKLRNEAKVI